MEKVEQLAKDRFPAMTAVYYTSDDVRGSDDVKIGS